MADTPQPLQVNSSPFSSPMHTYGNSIVVMTNPSDEIDKMEMTFRGMSVDANGKVTYVGEALMNDLGINRVIGMTQSIVNRVCVMSNFEKQEIPAMIDFFADILAKDLMINRKKYGISTVTARDTVHFEALSLVFVTMKRAFQEGDKRFWKGSQQDITTRVEGANQKRGLMSSIMGWGK